MSTWRPPTRGFLAKTALLLVFMFVFCPWAVRHYRLGVDPQAVRCLPYRFYVVSLDDRVPQLGKIYTYETRGLDPWFHDGTRFTKLVAGVPGEQVRVTADGIDVGGRHYWAPLEPRILRKTGRTAAELSRSYRLGPDEYLMLGTVNTPYDSRYTGPVHLDQFRGRAYPLW